MESEQMISMGSGSRYFQMQSEQLMSSSSLFSFRHSSFELTQIFEELPSATSISVSRPDSGDISPMILSYKIEFQYKQIRGWLHSVRAVIPALSLDVDFLLFWCYPWRTEAILVGASLSLDIGWRRISFVFVLHKKVSIISALYEAHFGVPMAGAVLNIVNVRLNASTIWSHVYTYPILQT